MLAKPKQRDLRADWDFGVLFQMIYTFCECEAALKDGQSTKQSQTAEAIQQLRKKKEVLLRYCTFAALLFARLPL